MRNERVATLVTGALGGLGTAIVDRLLDDGGEVIVCDRRAEDLPAWLERFAPDKRPRIEFHPVDLTKESQVDDLRRVLVEERVHVDRLVNNAGIQGAADVWKMDSKTWERVLRVNLFGTFYMTRAFSQQMVERGFGRIVNFASVYAYHPGPGQSPYAAAKAGIIGYTHSTALDLAPHGVTVNVIAPGLIWHERLIRSAGSCPSMPRGSPERVRDTRCHRWFAQPDAGVPTRTIWLSTSSPISAAI